MTLFTISRTTGGNDRAPLQQNNAGHPAPKPIYFGKVNFDLVPDSTGRLTLILTEEKLTGPVWNFVGKTNDGDFYLRIPPQAAQIDMELIGCTLWTFAGNGNAITLGDRKHTPRYWMVPVASTGNKLRRLIIGPSGRPPVQHQDHDDGHNDEKFNLEVLLTQAGTDTPLAIEIDPITKNPPPVGGFTVDAGTSGALL